MLKLTSEPVLVGAETYDIVVAIDWHNYERLAAEIPLHTDSLVIADPESGDVPGVVADSGAKFARLPMQKLAKDIKGGRVNMIALGALASLIGLPEDALVGVIDEVLARKGKDASEASIAAARAGIKTIILPKLNEKDLPDIPEEIQKKLKFIFIDQADQALAAAVRSPRRR